MSSSPRFSHDTIDLKSIQFITFIPSSALECFRCIIIQHSIVFPSSYFDNHQSSVISSSEAYINSDSKRICIAINDATAFIREHLNPRKIKQNTAVPLQQEIVQREIRSFLYVNIKSFRSATSILTIPNQYL
jgi:hypothetical protein